eukprot:TRINITY_DN67213_c7_g1_i1.p1 TRINITY_DN67213_c7_g1~~TRINITY_DN67213_c7_g1_i1.p1  ORF type:complete len:323 (+),score=16.94 TRINITY_DN67213_c7_g1_i1:73-1041(+)
MSARQRLQTIATQLNQKKSGTLPIVVSKEIKQKLLRGNGAGVVCLESTVITHGLPFPSNLDAAKKVEQAVRDCGATPATIAILNGVIHVGLSDEQLNHLAQPTTKVVKCSRRNLAFVLSAGLNGSTTVAATMLIADLIGIKVFATGGIGGVHRGVENTMDISADLIELGTTPVAVVSAGIKSILDIPRTLEVLETQGVPVMVYKSDRFPAFFTVDSGLASPMVVKSAEQCAEIIKLSTQMNNRNGLVIAVPPPSETAGDAERMETATKQALQEADTKGIKGHEVTPFLLNRIHQLTGGESLHANVALLINNAKVAAQIAQSL